MKKYLLPSLLILILGLGFAVAQNINKSVQLSQDSTGPIGFDTNNGVYFPAHILNPGAGVATVSTLTGTVATIASNSTDFIGQVTGGGATTGANVILFKQAYNAAPICLLVQSGGTASTLAWGTKATGIDFTSILGTGVVEYLCSGQK